MSIGKDVALSCMTSNKKLSSDKKTRFVRVFVTFRFSYSHKILSTRDSVYVMVNTVSLDFFNNCLVILGFYGWLHLWRTRQRQALIWQRVWFGIFIESVL